MGKRVGGGGRRNIERLLQARYVESNTQAVHAFRISIDGTPLPLLLISDGPIPIPKGLPFHSFGCFYEVKESIPHEELQFTIPKFEELAHH